MWTDGRNDPDPDFLSLGLSILIQNVRLDLISGSLPTHPQSSLPGHTRGCAPDNQSLAVGGTVRVRQSPLNPQSCLLMEDKHGGRIDICFQVSEGQGHKPRQRANSRKADPKPARHRGQPWRLSCVLGSTCTVSLSPQSSEGPRTCYGTSLASPLRSQPC